MLNLNTEIVCLNFQHRFLLTVLISLKSRELNMVVNQALDF